MERKLTEAQYLASLREAKFAADVAKAESANLHMATLEGQWAGFCTEKGIPLAKFMEESFPELYPLPEPFRP